MPHKVLTQPAKVFEFSFDGMRKARGRENLVKLSVIAEGTLNAVAFWFDLHLDDEATITSGGGDLRDQTPAYSGFGFPFTQT